MSAARSLIAAAVIVVAMGVGLLVAIRRADTPTAPSIPSAPPTHPIDAASQVVETPAPTAPALDANTAGAAAARDERDQLLQRLADSGRADEVWVDKATALFDAIGRAPVETHVIGCYVAGCGATFTFASLAAYRDRIAASATNRHLSRVDRRQTLQRSGEIRADGSVIVGLVLYRPD